MWPFSLFRKRAGPPPDMSFWLSPRFASAGDVKEPLTHAWTYVAVRAITDAFNAVPLRVYSGDMNDPTEQMDGPWVEFIRDPNVDLTEPEFWTLTLQHMLLEPGEAFWLLLNSRMQPVGLGEPPRWAMISGGRDWEDVTDERTGVLLGWRQRVGTEWVPRELHEVAHFRFPYKDNQLRGIAPYSAAKRSVRTDIKAAVHNESMLDNGAAPAGVLTAKDGNATPPTAEQMIAIRQQWNDIHGGPHNSGKVAVMGPLEYQQIGLTPKDMEYAALRDQTLREVAATYRVPLPMMGEWGDMHSKESSKVMMRAFWENGVLPVARYLQAVILRDVLKRHGGQGTWAKWDTSNVRALQQDQAEKIAAMKDLWSISVPLSEAARLAELEIEEYEGWDVPFVPASVEPLEFATEPPQAPPPMIPGQPPNVEDEDEEEEEERLLTLVRGNGNDRALKWHTYHRGIQRPGEKSLQTHIRRWQRKVRAETLAYVGGQQRRDTTFSQEELEAWLLAQGAEWEADLLERTQPTLEWITGNSLSRLDGQIGGLSTASMTHPAIVETMARQGARFVTDVTTTIQRQTAAEIAKGLAAGENITGLQDRVRAVMNAASSRSLAIARTEAGSASTTSRFQAYELEGVEKHSWLASPIETSRHDHVANDGKVVVVGQPFFNGLRYPLDMENGSAGDVVNCRCDTLPED